MRKLPIFIFLILLISLFSANLTIADTDCPPGTPPGAVCIKNPIESKTFEELIKVIIKFLQVLAGVVTSGVIVLAGYFFVTSAGDPAKITQAKKMILYALIGLAIILMAQGIIALVETVIKG